MSGVDLTSEQWASIQTQLTCKMCPLADSRDCNGEHCDCQFPTSAMLVVPGVVPVRHNRPLTDTECPYSPISVPPGDGWLFCNKCGWFGSVDPPGVWTDLTGPCKTCGGDGEVGYYDDDGSWVDCVECPVCEGSCRVGRAELRVTCPVCGGSGWTWEPMRQWDDPGRQVCRECDADADNSVLAATVNVEVLPVLHWSDNDEEAPACVSVGHDNGLAYVCKQRFGGHAVALDPLPVPGRDWVVVLTDIEVA